MHGISPFFSYWSLSCLLVYIQAETCKPQHLMVYTDGSVTKDQSGWGFTDKQGATTIHEDSTAYTVSVSWQWRWKQLLYPPLDCLKGWQSDHTSSQCIELATKSGMEAQTGLCQWSASTFENSCGCTKLDMPEWREVIEQIDWRAKQPSQVACLSEGLKCWGAWDTTWGHSSPSVFTNCSIVIPSTVRLPSLQTVPLSYPVQFAFRLYKLFPLQFAFRLYKLFPLQFAFRLYQLYLLQNQRTKELISAHNT